MTEAQSFIQNVNAIALKLTAIVNAGELFNENSVGLLEELAALDITLLTEDLKKSNYLGNRKIDINLALNNASDITAVAYSSATLTLNEGIVLNIPFETFEGSGITLELTSHADIKNYIVNSTIFTANVINTEVTIEDAIGDNPQIIRVRDADGTASNIDRVELQTYSGSFVESKPAFFWAKTTSSLQTLANRAGDIIALGNDIDSIIALASNQTEIAYLYTVRADLASIYDSLASITALDSNIDSVIAVNANEANILAVNQNKTNIDIVADKKQEITTIAVNLDEILAADDNAQTAAEQAQIANGFAQIASNKADSILSMQGVGQTLAAGESVSVNYNPATGIMTISVPQGIKGEKGDSFTVDAQGTIAFRQAFDDQLAGFSYFATDESKIYFKLSATTADWDVGSPFGKGDIGNGIADVSKTSTTGLVDTYTITFTDNSVTTFDVTNGNGIANVSKTNTVGHIDTYTITFTDNSVDTFEITNGSVTSVNGNTGAITVQEVLISGTNLKTINSVSLLGAGDIELNSTLANLTKSFSIGETADIVLTSSQDVATITVQKEVLDINRSSQFWDVATDGNNYEIENFALPTILTPSATSGNITLTLDTGSFITAHIGMKITGNGGVAVLTAVDGSATTTTDFTNTNPIASGNWNMQAIEFTPSGATLTSIDTTTPGSLISADNAVFSTSKQPFLNTIVLKNGNIVFNYMDGVTFEPYFRITDQNYNEVLPPTMLGAFDGSADRVKFSCVELSNGDLAFGIKNNIKTFTSLGVAVDTLNDTAINVPQLIVNNEELIVIYTNTAGGVVARRLNNDLTLIAQATVYNTTNACKKILATTIKTTQNIAIFFYDDVINFTHYSIIDTSLNILKQTSMALSLVIEELKSFNNGNIAVQHYVSRNNLGLIIYDSAGTELTTISPANTSAASKRTMEILRDTDELCVAYANTTTNLYYKRFSNAGAETLAETTIALSVAVTTENFIEITPLQFQNRNISFFYTDTAFNMKSISFKGANTKAPANQSLLVKTKTSIDTDFWDSLNTLTATEILNNQEVNYIISPDDSTTWKVVKTGSGERDIAKNNLGTWEYNSDTTYANETWTTATANTEAQAIKDALAINANKMSATQMGSVTSADFFPLGIKLDSVIALHTTTPMELPLSDGISINYDGNVRNVEAIKNVDYICEQPLSDLVRIEALANINLKIRVSK